MGTELQDMYIEAQKYVHVLERDVASLKAELKRCYGSHKAYVFNTTRQVRELVATIKTLGLSVSDEFAEEDQD